MKEKVRVKVEPPTAVPEVFQRMIDAHMTFDMSSLEDTPRVGTVLNYHPNRFAQMQCSAVQSINQCLVLICLFFSV